MAGLEPIKLWKIVGNPRQATRFMPPESKLLGQTPPPSRRHTDRFPKPLLAIATAGPETPFQPILEWVPVMVWLQVRESRWRSEVSAPGLLERRSEFGHSLRGQQTRYQSDLRSCKNRMPRSGEGTATPPTPQSRFGVNSSLLRPYHRATPQGMDHSRLQWLQPPARLSSIRARAAVLKSVRAMRLPGRSIPPRP